VLRLEPRPPNIEGKGAILIRDLVKTSLRMRPDRIVVGEIRDAAALDMLQAMNTGHDGSISTLHANTPRDALARLETMVLMAGMDLPVRAIREQVSSAVDLIIQQTRLKDGTRRIIGTCGFHAPPGPDGRVEVGYRVEPGYRRQGVATEVVHALFDWALTNGVDRFRASVSPGNVPSLAIIRGLGFTQVGVQIDDIDGEELVFDLDGWPPVRRPSSHAPASRQP
jgi:GNAT superfamily N-acetyltransferase